MIANTTTLPGHYTECLQLDLQKDGKKALLVNALSLFIFAVVLAVGHLIQPLNSFYHDAPSAGMLSLQLLVMMIGVIVYTILHELTHGVFMKLFSGVKPKYGFTGLYAYAGSENAYFNKKSYLVISLSPVVIWGLVLTVLLILLPKNWFWPVYLIQIFNLSGAAGDLYVSRLFTKMPRDILVRDTGVAMTVYCAAE